MSLLKNNRNINSVKFGRKAEKAYYRAKSEIEAMKGLGGGKINQRPNRYVKTIGLNFCILSSCFNGLKLVPYVPLWTTQPILYLNDETEGGKNIIQ